MRLFVLLSIMLMPFMVLGQIITIKPDTLANKPDIVVKNITPQEVNPIKGWRGMKVLRGGSLMGSISPLMNKTAGAYGAIEYFHELKRSDSLPFLYTLTIQGQLLSFEANHNYSVPYVNLDGSVTPNNEEYSLNGINISTMAEAHFMAAYPFVFSLAAGPSFTSASLGRTREYRYYAGNGSTNRFEFHTSENDKSLGYQARIKITFFIDDQFALSIFLGTQRYRYQVSPLMQMGGALIFPF